MDLNPLHPLSPFPFIACGKHEATLRALRLALYANWYGSLGRVVMEPILFNPSDPGTLRGIGLHAVGRIFGEVVVD